jgi:hypothetical protein
VVAAPKAAPAPMEEGPDDDVAPNVSDDDVGDDDAPR